MVKISLQFSKATIPFLYLLHKSDVTVKIIDFQMEKQFRGTQIRVFPPRFNCSLVRNYSAILRNEMVQAEAIIAHNSAQWNSDWNPYLSVCSKCRTLKTWSRTVSVQVQPVLYQSQTAHDPHNPVNYQCHYHWERCHKLSGQ